MMLRLLLSLTSLYCLFLPLALAQDSDLLTDVNGDGIVTVMGFGDSITFGFGDGTQPSDFDNDPPTDGRQGYLRRISELAGLPTINRGVTGEELTTGGIARVPRVVKGSSADLVLVMEGTNDAIARVGDSEIRRSLQQAINVITALGKTPLLLTLPPPCCDRAGSALFTRSYSRVARERANLNGITLIDIERAWDSTCVNKERCELYNRPFGLHPNTIGYDVFAQTVLASLYGIDIFSLEGAAELEAALQLEPGTVLVVPDA